MKLSRQDFFSDDLARNNWLGEVILNEDPENLGRIKVSVFGKFDLLEEDHIPWAHNGNMITAGSNSGSGSFSVPKVGSIVNIIFDNNNIYTPIYTFHQKPSDELIEEIGEDHQNFQSLIYDTQLAGAESGETDHLKIFYSTNEEKGLIINLRNTIINIRNDNEIKITNPNEDEITLKNDGTLEVTTSVMVTINTPEAIINAETKVEVNTPEALINANSIKLGENAAEAVIKGDTFKQLFDTHQHTGNLGSMTSAPIIPLSPSALSKVSKTK